jgi:hypothetical protein
VYITDQKTIAQYWNVPSPKIWTSFWHKNCRLDFVVRGRKESDNVRQKLELKTNYQDGQLTRLQYVKRMVFKALPVS